MRPLRPCAALLGLLCACAAGAPIDRPAPAPSAEPAPTPPASEAPPEPPPPEAPAPPENPERAERLLRWRHLARGLEDAFSNESPRPVVRGYGQIPHVQYRSDRRQAGQFAWYEGPEASVHGPVALAPEQAPCPQEVSGTVGSPAGSARLVRGPVEDELWVGQPPGLKRARLPRGAAHGVCLLAGRRRVWLGWSTPERPSELFSVSLRDGSVAPLRRDARPGLGALGPLRSSVEAPGLLVLAPEAEARSFVVVMDQEPLARWDPASRLLVEAGRVVIKTTPGQLDAAVSLARRRGAAGAPLRAVSRLPSPPPEVEGLAWVAASGDEPLQGVVGVALGE